MGSSHPIKTDGLQGGGTRWDRPTPVFAGWDRPTPFEVDKIKEREGWGAGGTGSVKEREGWGAGGTGSVPPHVTL